MRIAIISILSLLLLIMTCTAQEEKGAQISLQFTDVDIMEILASVSQQAQISIVCDVSVRGKATCNLTDIDFKQALDAVCRMNNLEWFRLFTQVNPDERVNPARLFKLLDALKELEASSLISEDPNTKGQTVFIPSVTSGLLDVSAIAAELKLREVYLIREKIDPEVAAAKKEEEKTRAERDARAQVLHTPPANVAEAAGEVWNYFNHMPPNQQFEVLRELGTMLMETVPPEQRREFFRNLGGRGEGRGAPDTLWQPQQ